MRLESGAGAGPALALLLRFHYLVVVLVAACGVLVWVPAPALADRVAGPGIVFCALYIWQVAGMQLYHQSREGRAALVEKEEPEQQQKGAERLPGLLLFLALPLGLAALALLVAPLAGLLLLVPAVVLLYQPERTPSLAGDWPAQWRRSRYQQTQLLTVSLVSMAVHVWYGG